MPYITVESGALSDEQSVWGLCPHTPAKGAMPLWNPDSQYFVILY